ncbi:MAG: 2-oxoacid:acceptor oxidoreductase subunit alpha [Firmicutes bacterium]|nr:2-oxoacid:acceptor oxidoreductase subunit alpha [Bacillota bacterium]
MSNILIQGNEACAEGAVAAGLCFFAGYPITPSTEIAEVLSEKLPVLGRTFIQMEDEIASMAAIIGASIGGCKAMTATSGPGFSLMQENIGFACAAEIPCVVVNVQRMGPSTGQPTSPAQGDLMQARWGTHGDHPIIVLYPSSVKEAFNLTVKAFNFSEKYRTPVILLMDEVVAHMREKVDIPAPDKLEIFERVKPTCQPEEYFPFGDAENGVPPLANFGEGYRFHITGLLHDKMGFPTLRADEILAWYERVFRKINSNLEDILLYEDVMIEDAEYAIIACGISARSARAAVRQARAAGKKLGMVKLLTITPFPDKHINEIASKVKNILVPELNFGQLILDVQRAAKGQCEVNGLNRVDGEIITPGQILERMGLKN